MRNEYFEEIVTNSVQYYENNYLSPEFTKQTSRESVIDYSAYFYAYAVKLIQNHFQKNRSEAEQSVSRLLNATEEALVEEVKKAAISDYNSVYTTLLDRFNRGINYGEESMDGFKIMLDSSAKIIAISMYWLENN